MANQLELMLRYISASWVKSHLSTFSQELILLDLNISFTIKTTSSHALAIYCNSPLFGRTKK